MFSVWAEQALLASGWQQDVRIDVDADGRIHAITPGAPPEGHRCAALVPAPVNVHSHAFQRAMAGLTETRGQDPSDSFWSWRALMYRFLDRLTPAHVEAIAAFVQMEMLEAGFATNVEFHYLHHQPDGTPYANLAEMAERIAAAADATGIGLTLLPVLYRFGGCDGRPLQGGQLRFRNDLDTFETLLQGAGKAVAQLPADTVLGVAPHSLRAVSPDDLRQVTALAAQGPIHMHLAEQPAEVDEVRAALGARPVEWAVDNLPLDARWCLIHLTQMIPAETLALADTGVVAGLCPITESSLGDGIFDGVRWMGAGGRIAFGSDSNILISLAEEMRVLENSQRLRDNSRAALALPGVSTGRRIFDGICTGGAMAAGRGAGRLAAGEWADMLAFDMAHVDLAGLRGDRILDCFMTSGGNAMVRDVWSAGRHVVRDGAHVQRERITQAYRKAAGDLRG